MPKLNERKDRRNALFQEQLEEINEKIARHSKEIESLLKEKKEIEIMMSIGKEKVEKVSQDEYNSESTFKEKILFCFSQGMELLSIPDLTKMICEYEPTLKENKRQTATNIRLAVMRMEKNKELVKYEIENFDTIKYGLTSKMKKEPL